jgi:hypothetical protein
MAREERRDHRERTFVVLDHQAQKLALEVGALRRRQPRHLLRRQHAVVQ